MGIMAIHAAHFAFPQRVMVGQAELCLFRLVAFDACFVGLCQGAEDHVGLRNRGFGSEGAACGRIEADAVLTGSPGGGVDLVAINAANAIGGMRSGGPVAHLGIAGVAAQANAIGGRGRALGEADDLADIATPFDVLAAVPMAIFALHALLGVEGVLVIPGLVRVAGRALFGADPGGAWNLNVFAELLLLRPGILLSIGG